MRARTFLQNSVLLDFVLWRSSAFISPTTSWNKMKSRTIITKAAAEDDSSLVRDMLSRIRQVNSMTEDLKKKSIIFQVDGIILGRVMPSVLTKLLATSTFRMDNNTLTLSPEKAGNTCSSRTDAVREVMEDLRKKGDIPGWRDELYPIASHFYDDPVFLMERAAVPVLGVLEYGVHLNGLVRKDDDDEDTMMWIARRSATKSKYPGMLDHIVAGGQPYGLSLMDNVIKECIEEAGIPEDITRAGIKPGGAISYTQYVSKYDYISRVVLFCYDLRLPDTFQPKPVDGEVDEFFLWDMDRVKESFCLHYDDPIKPNCYIVIIDYLLRNGHISPDTPGYLDILRELRSGDCQ
mmetsp:Transcript_33293/g.36836  ORF Transcript_33293/g.36836 Transcript_33293/m.36836 type:complete len:349 (-) Transcript_33293:141-1187(-)